MEVTLLRANIGNAIVGDISIMIIENWREN